MMLHLNHPADQGHKIAFVRTVDTDVCQSRRNPKEAIADTDFADDIALLSNAVNEAQELLTSVETQCKKVGHGINGPKTKALAYNIENLQPLRTFDGIILESKDDFQTSGRHAKDLDPKPECRTQETLLFSKGGVYSTVWI